MKKILVLLFLLLFAISANAQSNNKSVKVVFKKLPNTLAEFTSLPQASMKTPFDTASMFVVAMLVYPKDTPEAIAMVNYLKGPQPLSNYDKQFLADRMRDKGDYIAKSFFAGATPGNNYTPREPYTITVSENPYTYQEKGYAKLYIQSGGADSPRPIQLRQAKDGKWYLWEQYLLSDIRPPEDSNPWM